MKRFLLIAIAVLLTALLGVIARDALRSGSFGSRAGSLQIGDSKQHVERMLGRPTAVFTPESGAFMLGVRTETWAYGSNFQFRDAFPKEPPYFTPVRFRLFGPDEDDVVIEFDSTGQVSAVIIPRATR